MFDWISKWLSRGKRPAPAPTPEPGPLTMPWLHLKAFGFEKYWIIKGEPVLATVSQWHATDLITLWYKEQATIHPNVTSAEQYIAANP